ncbi:hypothetical protein OEZ85_008996 [Tetradesmus obliquus]|uniref:Tyrosine-protein kinase ephrin type A/B receptor-like domain-containing protein n=1 Tax=Tetradesmus obliquus TaxID=3088 RepID=A0ABY8TL18_TETOB|nr:hypothetical protein OEZ85_008996 [Tetradesmus obliquus]
MIMLPRGWCRAWWCLAFPVLLLLWSSCLCREVQSNFASVLVPGAVAVQHVQPARVTQYIRTQITVVLNGSLCEQLGQPQVPLLLSMRSHTVNASADTSAFAVRVQLNAPAGPGGVTVRLQLMNDAGAVRVFRDTVTWAAGASGSQAFWLALQNSPSSGQLLVQLQQPQGAVLDRNATSTVVEVQSPVVGFKTDVGYYRGMNSSTPRMHLTVSGASAFSSQFVYHTFLLPGSRPAAVPCHPLASSCSVAELEAVNNITVTGMRWLAPGQQQLEPIDLPINWGRLPPEAELRVAVRIEPKFNTRVAPQAGQVAVIVFGTPPGRCPPGSTLLSSDSLSRSNSSHDGPTYTDVAALQELALALFPEPDSSSSMANSSRTNSSSRSRTTGNSSNAAAAAAGSISRNLLLEGTGSSSSSSIPCNASIRANCSSAGAAGEAAAASTVIDMDPPFRPMVDRYIALLPPKPSGAGKLLLASSRWGDVVVVDATACDELQSDRFQVAWRRKERIPRQWPPSPAQNPRCTVCPNGTYSTRVDADECKVCPPGKYAASPFSTSCLFCPPGSFSYYWGAPACRTCLPGTFAAEAGSLFCNICRDGSTTSSEGATSCDVSLSDGGSVLDSQGASEYAILLSFGVVLDGTLLEAVTRSTTGINGSSEGIVAVLVASDTASALNVSLGSVQVLAVQQISSRQLLVNVSATVPVEAEGEAAAATTQDLSADELIQRLVDDPNTFLRTTQTLGAESASVQDIITQRSSSSGESSPGSGSQSARSDELCVTVEMGECPLSEESFTARLRAKQLGSAAGVLHSSSRQYPPPPGGSW